MISTGLDLVTPSAITENYKFFSSDFISELMVIKEGLLQ